MKPPIVSKVGRRHTTPVEKPVEEKKVIKVKREIKKEVDKINKLEKELNELKKTVLIMKKYFLKLK